MAMTTVRCRAVCAFAVLALLCGCFSSVCATAAADADAVVQVSCNRTDGNFLWRFAGEENWTSCMMVRSGRVMPLPDCAVCEEAEKEYEDRKCNAACNANQSAVAFTLKYLILSESKICTRLLPTTRVDASIAEKQDVCPRRYGEEGTPQILPTVPVRGGTPPTPPAVGSSAGKAAKDVAETEKHENTDNKAQGSDVSRTQPTDHAPKEESEEDAGAQDSEPKEKAPKAGRVASRDWTTLITDSGIMSRLKADGGVIVRGNTAPLLLLVLLGVWGVGALA
ncbi:mucin-like glycoprotein [Trypanosoma rangeli]|uniref:Mucin-like glycoprotein n=1 Tax=Trypanosoma rangeli TaxID=5698 RepID=A0A3R7MWU0_TRYRA|nr:mucin-like glycoprotein [Trypanosoma rangeli]RNE96542.1 mucin-like glycoprotein [Trypanosoma rangeli]|eukprot:RNE96542.1 mucin-like glycoprotein [Trypanosoma rangeli]